MNNINHKIRQRLQTQSISRWSLYLGAALLILSIIMALAFKANQGLVHEDSTLANIAVNLFLLCLVLQIIVFVCILVSLISIIFTKPRRMNFILSISGLLLAILASSVFMPAFEEARGSSARFSARNVNRISQIIKEYSNKNNGHLPPGENWCDVLIAFDSDVSYCLGRFVVEVPEGFCNYALNERVVDIRLQKMPGDIVLLFETSPGKNPHGGRELITAEHHEGKGCIVLFGDFSYKFVNAEDFDKLRWEP